MDSPRTSRLVGILENIVLVAIVLVVIQSFVEDLAELLDWSWGLRRNVLYAAFALDLFFSVEFLTRFYAAFVRGSARRYMQHERGWIDLVASIPLLLFASGPQLAAIATGGAAIVGVGRTLNLLKIIKAIRIARVLRLLRALKLFRNIKHTDSVITQNHVARLASLLVTTFVAVLMFFSLVDIVANLPGFERSFRERTLTIAGTIAEQGLADSSSESALRSFVAYEQSILVVRESGHTRFARYPNEVFSRQFGPGDYTWIRSGSVEVFVSLRPVFRNQSRDSLIYLLVIVSIIGVLLFLYAPFFCMTVSDPAYVMTRGMREAGYNLQVSLNEDGGSDEMTALARSYNEEFLPLKARNAEENAASDLTLDSLGDLLDPS